MAPTSNTPLTLFPSPEQASAISRLSPLSASKVIECLRQLRSLGALLTQDHCLALFVLATTPLDDVRAWLAFSHYRSGGGHAQPPEDRSDLYAHTPDATPPLDNNHPRDLRDPTLRSLSLDFRSERKNSPSTTMMQTGNLAEPSHKVHLNDPKGTSRDAIIHKSRPVTLESRHKHQHWCTAREHERPITTCDGFKRHESEHEKYYVFLPSGPVETTSEGYRRCALCCAFQPDDAHLESHKVLQFTKGSVATSRKSRRADLENMLQGRNLSEQAIEALVRKWHRSEKKESYSCGLCIQYFPTLMHRSNHMCSEHFSKGQNLKAWNDTFVLKGLLLNPKIHEICKATFGEDPCTYGSGVSWSQTDREDLQFKIQTGEMTAQEIATAALEKAIFAKERAIQGKVAPSIQDHSAVEFAHTLVQFHHQARSELSPRESGVETQTLGQSTDNELDLGFLQSLEYDEEHQRSVNTDSIESKRPLRQPLRNEDVDAADSKNDHNLKRHLRNAHWEESAPSSSRLQHAAFNLGGFPGVNFETSAMRLPTGPTGPKPIMNSSHSAAISPKDVLLDYEMTEDVFETSPSLNQDLSPQVRQQGSLLSIESTEVHTEQNRKEQDKTYLSIAQKNIPGNQASSEDLSHSAYMIRPSQRQSSTSKLGHPTTQYYSLPKKDIMTTSATGQLTLLGSNGYDSTLMSGPDMPFSEQNVPALLKQGSSRAINSSEFHKLTTALCDGNVPFWSSPATSSVINETPTQTCNPATRQNSLTQTQGANSMTFSNSAAHQADSTSGTIAPKKLKRPRVILADTDGHTNNRIAPQLLSHQHTEEVNRDLYTKRKCLGGENALNAREQRPTMVSDHG